MFTSHKQISPPSLVLKLKISEVSQKWIPKAVELKRIPTHKKCKCKKFCSQTRLVGEIYSSDVIMHRGYLFVCLAFPMLKNVNHCFTFFFKSLDELLWMSCIFHFIPLLLPVFLFKLLICNTVDSFIPHKYPEKHRTNNFVVILTLTC